MLLTIWSVIGKVWLSKREDHVTPERLKRAAGKTSEMQDCSGPFNPDINYEDVSKDSLIRLGKYRGKGICLTLTNPK